MTARAISGGTAARRSSPRPMTARTTRSGTAAQSEGARAR